MTSVVDFFYPLFEKILSRELFRYAACGGGNMVLDWVLYFLIYNYVIGHEIITFDLSHLINFSPLQGGLKGAITPHIATLCIVFPITLLTGFWLNRNVTFTQSTLRGWNQLLRYILVVAVNLLINYVGLKLCVEVLSWYPTPSKVLITLVTVAVSYFGQKYFSFRS